MKRLLWLLAFVGLLAGSLSAAESTRPNVLFIVVDDLRTNLGCYGDPLAITPHLDRLAARGTVFSRAYSQQAVCNPSRQSVLSGRRPDSIRVWDLKTNFRDTAPDVVSIPEHFKLNGYFTQGIGKIFHEIRYDAVVDPQSWSVPEQFEYVPKLEDYRLPENRRKGRNQKAAALEFADEPDDAYPDGQVAAAAVAALENFARKGTPQPFFLAVGFRKPHLPFTAPRRYWDLHESTRFGLDANATPPRGAPRVALHDSIELRGYTDVPPQGLLPPELVAKLRHGYYAATSFSDVQIGRVLAALDQTGLAENTIVIVWGDHGFHLGEHGLWAKTTNYEADTRVPLIIARPGQQRPGESTQALVELLDIYPTLVELCGLPHERKSKAAPSRPGLTSRNRPALKPPSASFRVRGYTGNRRKQWVTPFVLPGTVTSSGAVFPPTRWWRESCIRTQATSSSKRRTSPMRPTCGSYVIDSRVCCRPDLRGEEQTFERRSPCERLRSSPVWAARFSPDWPGLTDPFARDVPTWHFPFHHPPLLCDPTRQSLGSALKSERRRSSLLVSTRRHGPKKGPP